MFVDPYTFLFLRSLSEENRENEIR